MSTPIHRLSDLARERSFTVAVAESLTCGLLASEIGSDPDEVLQATVDRAVLHLVQLAERPR